MDKSPKKAAVVSTSQADQKASMRSIPSTTKGHKNPDVKPIGGKAMQGFKGN